MGYRMLTYLTIRLPGVIIALWMAFCIVFGSSAALLPSVLKDHGLQVEGAYNEVQHILNDHFGIPADPVIIVFERDNKESVVNLKQIMDQTLSDMIRIEGLETVISPKSDPRMLQGNTGYIVLGFNHPSFAMAPTISKIHSLIPKTPNITVGLTGKSVVQADVNRASLADMKKAEFIGIPLAFVILLVAFGGVLYALLPIVIGLIAVSGAMGIMYWLGMSGTMELSNFVLNVIPMVGLALSIDFALILTNRFREERSAGGVENTIEKAMLITLRTAGRSILFSAACVILGLAAIYLIRLPMFQSVAVAAITVLIISVILNLTLLPAMLSLLNRRESTKYRASTAKLRLKWLQWSSFVMRKPLRMTFFSSMLIVLCVIPVRNLETSIPDASSLPRAYESRWAANTYHSQFESKTSSSIPIVIQDKDLGVGSSKWPAIVQLQQSLKHDPNVLTMEPILQNIHNELLLSVTIRGIPGSEEASEWLRTWEEKGEHYTLPFILGGEAKYEQEIQDEIHERLPSVLLWIGLSNFILLFIAFRSIVIPLKALLMNVLSLGAAFGILVFIFQDGRLGMEPSSIAIMIPVFIFGLAFGISMDYGVFLLSRMTEEYEATGNYKQAIQEGLVSTGRIITSAAAILLVVTIPFAFGEVAGVKQLGVGIATAVFIDATLIRLVLVPSLMMLMGRLNWWLPRFLR
ncbi:MMPL family transporter [Paenibacillus pini]|uniref:Transporter n=1 Tax=Paenibacillus pini JCM 16418 TaxID=1236976 RepID=W7YYZ4_9BACL|nr:MMPL family transporter [Paenibacillus pini]GAF07599.1 transporter [Paenibacillus pini JCM 16418]